MHILAHSFLASGTWLAMYHNLFFFSSWVLSLPTEISSGIQNHFEGCYFMMFTKMNCQCVEWFSLPFPDVDRGIYRV